MTVVASRRLLQVVVACACVVPLATGGLGVVRGPAWLAGVHDVSRDLDSHFRYVSGIFLAVGVGFASCIPAIEARTARFRLLAALVVAGGLARALSLAEVGAPSTGHLLGLAMELAVVPVLAMWQGRVAGASQRLARAGSSRSAPASTVGR